MHAAERASVIVVSRGRPAALVACLKALALSDHPAFEVVVVADPAGVAAVAAAGLGGLAKLAAYDEANISAARNIGLRAAAGEIVAFIDDDAIAEPTWLSRLTAPFADRRVLAAGGFVRGRSGFALQWGARVCDATGRSRPLDVPRDMVSLHVGRPGAAVRTEGTNMAFRRRALLALGGFDPAYRFYHDETDLNLRLAATGAVTAIVPDAQVRHGFAPSATRRADRAPLSLHEIGASTAVLLRRHAPPQGHDGALAALRTEQRQRALRHLVTGALEPRDVTRLLRSLENGLEDGARRPLAPLAPLAEDGAPFRPFGATGLRPARVFGGWTWQAARLRAAAAQAARDGAIVTVILLSPLPWRHRESFHPGGWWEQQGGLHGRSDRALPGGSGGVRARIAREIRRLATIRPVDTLCG